MKGFPGDSDNESPGVGRGCSKPRQILESTLISERAKFAIEPAKDDLDQVKAERAKLIMEKIKSHRRSNRGNGEENRTRREVLERIKAAKNKNRNDGTLLADSEESMAVNYNTDSGICSSHSPKIQLKNRNISQSQWSVSQDASDQTSTSPSLLQKTSDSDVSKTAQTTANVTSKRKPNNVVLDQFGMTSNPLLSPTSKNESKGSGPGSPTNQNSSSFDVNELHNMNSFLKSGSSSNGERPKQLPMKAQNTKLNCPSVLGHIDTQRNQPINGRATSPKAGHSPEESNLSEQNRISNFPTQNKERSFPARNKESNLSAKKQPHVTRAFMDPNHPLFLPPDFSIPPPTIKDDKTSFSQRMSKEPSPNNQTSTFSQSSFKESYSDYQCQSYSQELPKRHPARNNFRSFVQKEPSPNSPFISLSRDISKEPNNHIEKYNSDISPKEPSSKKQIPSFFLGTSAELSSSSQIQSFFRGASKEVSPNNHGPNIPHAAFKEVGLNQVSHFSPGSSKEQRPDNQIPSYFGGSAPQVTPKNRIKNYSSGEFTEPPPNNQIPRAGLTEPPPSHQIPRASFTEPPPSHQIPRADFTEPPPNNQIPRAGFTEPPPNHLIPSGDFTEPPPNNQIPSFFQPFTTCEQQQDSRSIEDTVDIPPLFQPENLPNKEVTARGPLLSKFMSNSTVSKQFTQVDGIQAVSRLCDYKLPLRHKLSGLKRLIASDVFNSHLAIQIMDPDVGNIVQGIRKMIEYCRQKPDDENSRPSLILSLKVLNRCLDFAANDTSVKSFINGLSRTMSSDKGEVTSLTFLQQLLKMCDPRGGVFSEEYTSRLCRELLETDSFDMLGLSEMSLDKPETIVETFKLCSGISLGISDCSLVKNVPEQYRIVSLFLLNEEGAEESLAQILLTDDSQKDPRSVWGVNHPTKISKGKVGHADINHMQEMVFVTLFPTGHFFAYMDEKSNIEERLKEIDRLLDMSPHNNQSVQEIRPGMMVCVKWEHLKKRSRKPFIKFGMARALVMDIFEEAKDEKVSVYLIDFGITGEVLLETLTPPPKDLIPIPPRITFCRLQGVGPAPKTELLRECILAISRLSTTSSVASLVSRPSLEAGRILSQLIGSGEEVIQVAALTTLATVAGTQLANKMLVRATGDAKPCARELVCPAVVSYLLKGWGCHGNIPRKCVLMSLEILKNLLDQLHPKDMEFVYENTKIIEVLFSLKDKKDVMMTHETVINKLIEMPRKGNNYDPDVHINSLKRREIAAKQQKSRYVPGSKPAVPGGELARIVGGQRKEESQPLIFANSDIRERQQTPKRESEERVDGPINPYNPHKVVSASGPVWANVDDISNRRTSQILNDTTFFEEGNNIEKQKEINEARSNLDLSSDEEVQPDAPTSPKAETVKKMEEHEGSSSRKITSAATAEDSLSSLTVNHILTEKHGAAVELWSLQHKGDICRSRLSTLICGMLNSLRGGSIFIGVRQNGIIDGIRLTRQDRDQFRQQVDRILASMINPRVPPNTVDIDFHRAEDKTRPVAENYVIRIKVLGRSSVADNKVYMAHNLIAPGVKEGMYLRGANGNNDKLNQEEIMQELKKQTEKMHNKKIAKLATEMGNLET